MKKGEIWLVDIPDSNGHEQIGTRPVIVLSEAEANITVIIPFTSNLQALQYPHTLEVRPSKTNALDTISVALVFQIRAIDKKRLKSKMGILEDSILKEVENMLRKLLHL